MSSHGSPRLTYTDGGCLLTQHFDIFLREARTGDVVLLSGSNCFSRTIGLCTESPWTHVAMVIRISGARNWISDVQLRHSQRKEPPCSFLTAPAAAYVPQYPAAQYAWARMTMDGVIPRYGDHPVAHDHPPAHAATSPDEVLALWESVRHSDGTYDYISQTRDRCGVRLVDARERLEGFSGRWCSWRQLTGYDWRLASNRSRITDLVTRYWGRPYETGTAELFRSAFRICCYNSESNLDSFFCSELVAQSYMDMGLVRNDHESRPSNWYNPASFGICSPDEVEFVGNGDPDAGRFSLGMEISLLQSSHGRWTALPFYDLLCMWLWCPCECPDETLILAGFPEDTGPTQREGRDGPNGLWNY